MAELWINTRTGVKSGSPLLRAQPIHGAMDRHGTPLWIEHHGQRLRVRELYDSWSISDGTRGVCGLARMAMMDDGSRWFLKRDLVKGGWVGESVR